MPSNSQKAIQTAFPNPIGVNMEIHMHLGMHITLLFNERLDSLKARIKCCKNKYKVLKDASKENWLLN